MPSDPWRVGWRPLLPRSLTPRLLSLPRLPKKKRPRVKTRKSLSLRRNPTLMMSLRRTLMRCAVNQCSARGPQSDCLACKQCLPTHTNQFGRPTPRCIICAIAERICWLSDCQACTCLILISACEEPVNHVILLFTCCTQDSIHQTSPSTSALLPPCSRRAWTLQYCCAP